MEIFEYSPKGVCSSKMIFKIENDTIINVKIIGGCPGNGLGVSALVQNQKTDEKTTTNMIQKTNPIFAVNPLISKEI